MISSRKHKISRLEEFSDAVFGFALTLLALSSGMPTSYTQLIDLLQGLPAFACCFALMVWIWYEHDTFFERHPMNDGLTMVLNSLLLFVVLVYVYPLKFMFTSFMAQFGLGAAETVERMTLDQLKSASAIYGFGFFVLMTLFALLYLNAHRRRADLEMSTLEAFDARSQAGHHLVSAGVGLFAMLFAVIAPKEVAFLSPSSFALMGPGHAIFGSRRGRMRKALEATLVSRSQPLAT